MIEFAVKSSGAYWDVKRVVMHIPHGLGAALLYLLFGPHPMYAFTLAFFFYELVEDWRIFDHAFHDLRGWLIGFPAGFLLAIGVKLFFIKVLPMHFIATTFWL